MKKLSIVFVILSFFCFALPAQAAPGMVLTAQEGAWAIRGGEKIKLEVKSEILAGDLLMTDATGRVQIIFADDTAVSLGADTQVSVAEFVFDEPGKEPSFSAGVAKGAARFVTGKVVEQNREGFSVTTPQATVGIRGTTFTVSVSDTGVTSVIGLSVNSAFPITVTNLATGSSSVIDKSGMAVDASPAGNSSYQTPPGQFSQSSSQVSGTSASRASNSGGLSMQSREETSQAGTSPTGETGAALAQSSSPELAGTQELALSDNNSSEQTMGGSTPAGGNSSGGSASSGLAPSTPGLSPSTPGLTPSTPSLDPTVPSMDPTIPGTDPSGLQGHFAGTLYSAPNSAYSPVGNFSFNVGLNAGTAKITGTTLTITDTAAGLGGLTASQNGASTISNGQFNTNLKVDQTVNYVNQGTSGYMKGGFDQTKNPVEVDGNWKINGAYSEGYFDGEKQ